MMNLISVLFVYGINLYPFFFICAHLVVNHYIQQDGNIILMQGINGLVQLFSGAIFRGNGSFLKEFTQIKQIVRVIPNGVLAFAAFTGRGEPDHVDADIIEGRCAFCYLRP